MNKKTVLYLMLAAAMTASIAACSSDDDEQNTPATTTGTTQPDAKVRKITLKVSENSMKDEDGSEARLTRGSVITTESLEAFFMSAGSNQYTASKSDGTWNTSPETWPRTEDATPVSFYAYNSENTSFNTDTEPYINFTVDENASEQKDLLYAMKETSYTASGGKVWLNFKHACAAVDFTFQISKTLRNTVGGALTVTSIQLKNVNNKGKFYFNTESWSDITGGSTVYTMNSANVDIDTIPVSPSCGTLFMIPQNLSATSAELEIKFMKGESEVTRTISLQDATYTWVGGTHYTVPIKISTSIYN